MDIHSRDDYFILPEEGIQEIDMTKKTPKKTDEAPNPKTVRRRENRVKHNAVVDRIRANEEIWSRFEALHKSVSELPSATERLEAANALARLMRKPTGPTSVEKIRAKLTKLEEQKAVLEARLAEM